MQLLPLIFVASAHMLASNAECIILPITPNDINGLTLCGYGSLAAGCVCCPDNKSACLSPIQVCTLGVGLDYICENNPQYGSDCASEGFADCGSKCMLSGGTSQGSWCPAGYSCGTESNCIPDSLSSSSSGSTSLAAVSVLGSSTAKSHLYFFSGYCAYL